MQAKPRTLEQIELDLLIQGLLRVHGIDLTAYASPPLRRRLDAWLRHQGHQSYAQALYPLLRSPTLLQEMLQAVLIGFTEMFRDPPVFALLRQQVLPRLATSANINVWHAGCASGEEAYSMAVLLQEAGLGKRSRIYATDINEAGLDKARHGMLNAAQWQRAASNYKASGGAASLDDYFQMQAQQACPAAELQRQLVIAKHNAVRDANFAQVDLLLCRNLLIYYGSQTKDQCLQFLDRSLRNGGFLVLGLHETLALHPMAGRYAEVQAQSRVYRKLEDAV